MPAPKQVTVHYKQSFPLWKSCNSHSTPLQLHGKKESKKRCTHIKDKSPYVRPQKCRYQILEACIILRTEEARDENSTFWLDLALYTGVIALHTKYMNNCHSSHNYMLICCYCSLLLFLTKMMMTAYIVLFSALQQTHCTRM